MTDAATVHARPDIAEPQQPIETDALIVGAGPVGLFQVFELGLLEIRAHVVDSLPKVGGQCVELYPDKPIYDIPAVPVCTGRELVDSLMAQIEPFGATFHLGEEVQTVERRRDGRFNVSTSKGTRFVAKTVFIAAGVGSFQPRTLKVAGIERYRDTQLFYRVRTPEQFRDKDVVVCGGGDSALDWALDLVDIARSVTLLHRREGFRAAPASVAKMRMLCEAWRMQSITGQVTGFDDDNGLLKRIKVTGGDGITRSLELDCLLVFFGLSPQLGPIARWGIDVERRQIPVDTASFETNVPGIFAVGDVNTYPGKKKLILSGFHEAALAAYGAAHHVFPERRIHVEYTTTSTRLHKVLGVESPVFD
ncbi:thioredoxin reductase (NADPH) [Paraburkholderia caballeronis]|uniref:NAD(P)/FAD-dependent oxidoreductase n=1 Tax=Paraburkholderia caballeronis TaxID=416943 RepID=UPI0010657A03|nr:NAD(P)/FAD-dependent oxidoreductase [Paraburkholderia caballeronis]TDV34062.1 thioredoxin reductase (NADPH) [Paraburkholderia caballeronis]